jgi:hypothetical protein
LSLQHPTSAFNLSYLHGCRRFAEASRCPSCVLAIVFSSQLRDAFTNFIISTRQESMFLGWRRSLCGCVWVISLRSAARSFHESTLATTFPGHTELNVSADIFYVHNARMARLTSC